MLEPWILGIYLEGLSFIPIFTPILLCTLRDYYNIQRECKVYRPTEAIYEELLGIFETLHQSYKRRYFRNGYKDLSDL